MQELEPSPIDDSPINISKSEYFPPPARAGDAYPRSATTLGIHNHSLTWWCPSTLWMTAQRLC